MARITAVHVSGQRHAREAEALQCGYCPSGMIMAAVALLRQHPDPSEKTIREFMQVKVRPSDIWTANICDRNST